MNGRLGIRTSLCSPAYGGRIAFVRRRWLPLLAGLLVVTAFAFGAAAAAAAPVPFNPAHPTVFIAQGSPTQLNSATQSGGAISFTPVGGTIPALAYNAIAYDTCNNFIYAVQTTTTTSGSIGSVIKIASDGSITYTGINVGTGFNTGAFRTGHRHL